MLYPTELRAHTENQALRSAVFTHSKLLSEMALRFNEERQIRFSNYSESGTTERIHVCEKLKVREPFLYVPLGMIFARFKIRGKQVPERLKTEDLSPAHRI
jgi:hypothetical protein